MGQWRHSVGMFNVKSVYKRFRKLEENPNPTLLSFICQCLDVKPVKVFLGLLKVFAYCSIIISFLAFSLFLYPFFNLFSYQCPFVNYFVYVFSMITLLPWHISASSRSIYLFLKSQLSEKTKNILFFIFVIKMLLIISGSVEINPGPHMSKNLSFAVWNLDSLPARDFARIPLIESLQTTYDFDLFGVCESMLTENISNEDIFSLMVSPLTPSGQTKILLPGMEAFASTSKSFFRLRKDVI